MIYRATRIIDNFFDELDIKHAVEETDSLSYIEAGFTGDNMTVTLRFFSGDDDSDVKVLTKPFARFPENKFGAGYKMMNELNNTYKYLKFTMDSDGDVTAEYDFPLCLDDDMVAQAAKELTFRTASIVDEAYPDIMKAIWG